MSMVLASMKIMNILLCNYYFYHLNLITDNSMEGLFTADALFTLFMLVLLQVVLGFDNLLYITLESKKAPENRQSYVRKLGVGMAIVLRIVLLVALMSLIQYFQDPFMSLKWYEFIEFSINIHSVIVLLGGAFIIYTAIKEIWHMMYLKEHVETDTGRSSVGAIIFWIVVMNLVFSFDSILSAMALTSSMEFKAQIILMSVAIIAGGVLMIVLADRVADFLKKNRMYEVLGLFILLIVGVMLLTEGGHLAHLYLFGNPITPMSKTTFYFVIIVLVLLDVVQGRYQRNLLKADEIADEKAEMIKTEEKA